MNIEEYNNKFASCYMLGILPKGEVLFPIDRLSSNREIIAINIKVISIEPRIIESEINPKSESPYYIAMDNEQKNNYMKSMQGYDYKEFVEKRELWEEKLNGKVICFKPKFDIDPNNPNKIIKNAIIEFEESFEGNRSNHEYMMIPVLSVDNKEFERKLIQGESIDLKDYNHFMDHPEYIICGSYIYFNFKTWDQKEKYSCTWIHSRGSNEIQKLKIDINSIDHIITSNNNILFIDKEILNNIEEDKNYEVIEVEDIEIANKHIIEKVVNNDESEFLYNLKKKTLELGLSYNMDDLVNLHTCIKTNPLTILSGMSSTGKSKLATIYSNALSCIEENENLLFLPINPSYTEPSDLLGYLNNTTGIYTPSDTRLVDFLNHANEEKNKMHIVIFDEMNLSQVEYWFAPFISLLEREPHERDLYLYNPESNCINRKQYPPSIRIGENVRFIGTVNVDETTKDFSDRLLDRANIIILEKCSFRILKSEILEFDNKDIKLKSEDNYKNDYTYLEWIKKDKWLEAYSDKEIEFFDELHEIINKYDNQKGVSFRIVEKIGEFLNNIPKDNDNKLLLSRCKAFDLQVNQRIITKIKGTEQQFGNLIGTINNYASNEIVDSELSRFFSREEWKEISDFTLTKKEINRKAKELGVYGYAN